MIKKSLARWQLIVYDLIIFAFTDLLLLVFYQGQERLPLNSILIHTVIGCVCIFAIRIAGGIYLQIWRYGGIQCYIRLLFTDGSDEGHSAIYFCRYPGEVLKIAAADTGGVGLSIATLALNLGVQ